jgi:predicted component of type VI protein secretion system
MIDSALADTSVAFHRRIAEDLTACLEALQELESALREQCEADLQSRVAAAESRMAGAKKAARDEIDRELTRLRAEAQELDDSLPSTRRTREALDACLSRVQSALGEKEHDHVVEIPNAGEVTVVRPVSEPRTSDPDIASREHALQELLRIARFFETTEPTNPIRYVLERAVRWARMPLPALYDELITDKSERAKLFRLVGISRNDEPEE